jgi:hypothetical protein
MISLRVPGLKSWFDPRSVPALSFELCTKLRTRMANKRGLFITLTYNRDDYESPLDLFYAQKERQDVPKFIRRLQKYLGTPLSGLWMRKMEFQTNGWVHFHMVLDYRKTIPHCKLTELWGHGHVWVERWSEHMAGYLSKYIGKGDKVPGWILSMKPKTIKIVASSPGFWGNPPQPKREKPPKQFWAGLGMYIPIGARLEQYNQSTLARVKIAPNNDTGDKEEQPRCKYFTLNVDIGTLLVFLMQHNVQLSGSEDRWVDIDCDRDTLETVATKAKLHLINRRNPAKWPNYIHAILQSMLDYEPMAETG